MSKLCYDIGYSALYHSGGTGTLSGQEKVFLIIYDYLTKVTKVTKT